MLRQTRSKARRGVTPTVTRTATRRASRTGRHLVGGEMVGGLATFSVTVLPGPVAEAATDTVTNCSGSASVSGSLPYEVANAGPADTIAFALSPPCPTITLASPIDIGQDLTITGPGAGALAARRWAKETTRYSSRRRTRRPRSTS